MILLILALFMQQSQTQADFRGVQIQHDTTEYEMYNRLQKDRDAIEDIWRPTPQLLSDYRAARRCYTQFHLYKADSCQAELAKVDRDLERPKD